MAASKAPAKPRKSSTRKVSKQTAQAASEKPTEKVFTYLPPATISTLKREAEADRRKFSEFLRWHLVEWAEELDAARNKKGSK